LRYVEDALARFALHGTVYLEEGSVGLDSSQGQFKVPLGTLPARWLSLDEATRRERAADTVRQFVRQRNSLAAPAPISVGFDYRFWGGALALGCVIVLGVHFLWPTELVSGASSGSARTAASQLDPESSLARARRVCEATKARVARGATVNVADTDGWVVEYSALRVAGGSPLEGSLAAYVKAPGSTEASAWIWPEEPSLVALAGSEPRVQLTVEPLSKGGEAWERLTLSFSGPLVDPYFREEERPRYYHVAAALTSSLEATHSGLYARCEHEHSHYLGSWFRGPNEGGAATALVFSLGAFAEPPHIASPFLKPLGQKPDLGYAFSNIETGTAKLTRAALSDAMGRSQGMVTGAPKAPVTLTFAFRDGSSATRASRQLSRGAGLIAD